MAFSAQFAAAQDETTAPDSAAVADTAAAEEAIAAEANPFQAAPSEIPLHQQLKTKFIEGGPGFMASIILCLIFGLAISIERILYLSLSKTNTKKLLSKIETALNEGGVRSSKGSMPQHPRSCRQHLLPGLPPYGTQGYRGSREDSGFPTARYR